MNHPLHQLIGQKLNSITFNNNIKLAIDRACGGNQSIPLFCSSDKSNDTEFTNPDLIIIKDNKIKFIIEIEESNIRPVQIFGKFFSSALSKYYIHEVENNAKIEKDVNCIFIQILDASKLKPETKKFNQGMKIEYFINQSLSNNEFNINEYKLFYFPNTSVEHIMEFIKENV